MLLDPLGVSLDDSWSMPSLTSLKSKWNLFWAETDDESFPDSLNSPASLLVDDKLPPSSSMICAFLIFSSSTLHFVYSEMMKSVPRPNSLLISTLPPNALTISLQILSPRPTPYLLCCYVSFSLLKFMNNLSLFSCEMPHPESLKVIWKLINFSFSTGCFSSSMISLSSRISLSGAPPFKSSESLILNELLSSLETSST